MKKVFCLLIAIVCLFMLSTCMNGGATVVLGDKDNDLADARMEQLFHAIKEQDIDAVMACFSHKALAEAENMDAGVDHLLSFVQGELTSWTRDGAPTVYDTSENGGKTKQLVTWYTLDTKTQSYLVFLLDYPVDTIDPENEGLYSLRIIRAEDEHKLEGTWDEWAVPGVYVPG